MVQDGAGLLELLLKKFIGMNLWVCWTKLRICTSSSGYGFVGHRRWDGSGKIAIGKGKCGAIILWESVVTGLSAPNKAAEQQEYRFLLPG